MSPKPSILCITGENVQLCREEHLLTLMNRSRDSLCLSVPVSGFKTKVTTPVNTGKTSCGRLFWISADAQTLSSRDDLFWEQKGSSDQQFESLLKAGWATNANKQEICPCPSHLFPCLIHNFAHRWVPWTQGVEDKKGLFKTFYRFAYIFTKRF